MSDFSIRAAQTVPDLTATQNDSAENGKKATSKTAQAQHHATTGGTKDPLDIIDTSSDAGNYLSALNSQLSISNSEQEKEFDEKQLKSAEKQRQLLKILGIGLSPEEFAKETTDLAKQIAGIAKDYAANSGGTTPSTSAAAPSATSDAATTAQQADAAAATAGPDKTAGSAGAAAATSPPPAAAAAAPPAKPVGPSAGALAKGGTGNAGQAPATGSTSTNSAAAGTGTGSSTPSAATAGGATATDPDSAAAKNPNSFFAEVEADFKELKKLETRALSTLNLSPDKKKKDEAKKLGGEFNDAVNTTAEAASAAGADSSIGAAIAGQSLDLSKVAINLTA